MIYEHRIPGLTKSSPHVSAWAKQVFDVSDIVPQTPAAIAGRSPTLGSHVFFQRTVYLWAFPARLLPPVFGIFRFPSSSAQSWT